jgi:transposase-like protein
VRPDILRRWRKQAEGRAGLKNEDVFPGNGKLTSNDEELRALRRELEEVKQERDFLKKRSIVRPAAATAVLISTRNCRRVVSG